MAKTFNGAVRERPILFSSAMVRAILDGRKTQTRRVVKPQPSLTLDGVPFETYQPASGMRWNASHAKPHECGGEWSFMFPGFTEGSWRCPYGVPGDHLWVRETFCVIDDTEHDGTKWIDYRATPRWAESHPGGWDAAPEDPEALKWKPSIHMPRWASRLSLEITEVRVERLDDISNEDAIAEGYVSRLAFLTGDFANSLPKETWLWCISFKPVDGRPSLKEGSDQ